MNTRILVADHDPASRLTLVRIIEGLGHRVEQACDGFEALKALRSPETPTIAIVDWMMPGLDGSRICHEVRSRDAQVYTYLLLVGDSRRPDDLIEGLNAGADDFITRPIQSVELRARLHAARRIVKLQDELRRAHDYEWYRATHDRATGAWNRDAFLEFVGRDIARSRRDGSPLSVAYVQLLDVIGLIERLGYSAGNALVKEAVQRCRERVRPYDIVGRFGGSALAISAPGCDEDCGRALLSRIVAHLQSSPVRYIDEYPPIPLTLRFNVVSLTPEDEDAEALMRRVESFG